MPLQSPNPVSHDGEQAPFEQPWVACVLAHGTHAGSSQPNAGSLVATQAPLHSFTPAPVHEPPVPDELVVIMPPAPPVLLDELLLLLLLLVMLPPAPVPELLDVTCPPCPAEPPCCWPLVVNAHAANHATKEARASGLVGGSDFIVRGYTNGADPVGASLALVEEGYG
jgi:hypothetical protein